MTTFELCKMLVEKNKISSDKVDVFYAAGRLTEEEYKTLIFTLQTEEEEIEK